MLTDFMKEYFGGNLAPFAAIALFVCIVGVSLWLTPRLAKWIDQRRSTSKGFFDDMLEEPPENNETK